MSVKLTPVLVPLFLLLLGAILQSAPLAHAQSCDTTYSTGSPPPQQLTIGSSGTYCFSQGTYDTQITITASDVTLTGAPGTTASQVVISPTNVTWNAVNPDDLDGVTVPTVPAIIYASGGSTAITGVNVEDLTVDGSGAGSAVASSNPCDAGQVGGGSAWGCYFGILFLGASGEIVNSTVTNMNTPTSPSDGLAIQVGTTINDSVSSSVIVSGNTVTNYAKNGITCDGGQPPTTSTTACTITDNTVSPLPTAGARSATNGIQLGLATGTISGNTVSGNAWSGATNDILTTTDFGLGIVIQQSPGPVEISGNTLAGNDVGILMFFDTGSVTATSNTVSGSTEAGLAIWDEYVSSQSATDNSFSNEPVGIAAISDMSGLNDTVTVSGNTFSGVTNSTLVAGSSGGFATIVGATSNPVDEGQPVTFSASSSGGSGSYTYLWGGLPTGSCSNDTVASVTCTPSTTAGSPFSVVVQVNTVTSGPLLLNVTADPTVSVAPAGPLSYDEGQAATALTADVAYSGPNAAPVEWYSSGTSSCSSSSTNTGTSGTSFTPSTATAGATYYCAVVSDTGVSGYTSASNSVEVTVAGPVSGPALIVTPNSGPAGSPVSLSGSGFSASTSYYYCFEAGASSATACTSNEYQFTTDQSGAIPPSTGLGGVSATGLVVVYNPLTHLVAASARFTAVAPTSGATITVSPPTGTVPTGAQVTITGANFAPGSTITIAYSGGNIRVDSVTTTSASGGFTALVTILAAQPGSSEPSFTAIGSDAPTDAASAPYSVTNVNEYVSTSLATPASGTVTVDQTATTGVNVTIQDAPSTSGQLIISDLSGPSAGEPVLNVADGVYFDVLASNLPSTATASACFTNPSITSITSLFWAPGGGGFSLIASTFSAPDTICTSAPISISQLSGTNFEAGIVVPVGVSAPPTSLSFVCPSAEATVGVPTTCTVTVSSATSAPSGTVRLSSVPQSDQLGLQSACTLTAASATSASCNVAIFPAVGAASRYTLTASYAGTLGYASSSGQVTLTVVDPTTTSIACSPSTVPLGSPTTCAVTVEDSVAPSSYPTAFVLLSGSSSLGANASASCNLDASGTCSVVLTPSSPGTFEIDGQYVGDATHGPSQGSASITVAAVSTAATSSSTTNSSTVTTSACTTTSASTTTLSTETTTTALPFSTTRLNPSTSTSTISTATSSVTPSTVTQTSTSSSTTTSIVIRVVSSTPARSPCTAVSSELYLLAGVVAAVAVLLLGVAMWRRRAETRSGPGPSVSGPPAAQTTTSSLPSGLTATPDASASEHVRPP